MIYVTQKDIEAGVRERPGRCPAARAILRRLAKLGIDPDELSWEIDSQAIQMLCINKIYVYHDYVYFHYNGFFYRYSVPENANIFIQKFDSGQKVNPIKFEIRFVSKWKL